MAVRLSVIAGLASLIVVGSVLSYLGSAEATTSDDAATAANDAVSDVSDTSNEAPKLSCCDYRQAEKKPYILVSTLDGRVSAVDASANGGQLLWSLQTDTEPLLASSLSNIPFYYDDREFRLIPSMDGHFYMYNDAAVQSVPFNVDALLSGSLKLGADVLAGGKQIRTYFIDYVSGKLHQSCGASGCEQYGDPSTHPAFRKLIVKRTTQTVRGVDPSSGAERWNLTVGEHELLLDESEENADEGSCICVNDGEKFLYGSKQNPQPVRPTKSNWESSGLDDIELKLVPPEGLLLAYDRNDPSVLLWEKKLDSPVVQLWTLSSDGKLIERTIFDQSLVPAFSYYSVGEGQSASAELTGRFGSQQQERMIYIGTYNDQKYVVRSPEERRKIKDLRADAREQSRIYLMAPAAQLQLTDESSAAGRCEHDCPTCASDEVNGLILREQYPRDMGWYLYKHSTPSHRIENWNRSPKPPSKREKVQRHMLEFLGGLPAGYFCFLVLATVGAVFLPAALVARFYGQQLRELKEAASRRLKIGDKPSDTTTSPSTPSPPTETTNLSPSSPSTPSQDSPGPLSVSATDIAGHSYGRYSTDFDPIQQLGKGGFGIVVESRNKHDDQLYAVKRIAFALTRSSKERVRREVKALAQLEHPGIVRYFSAWFEEPPAEWQKRMDQEMFKKCQKTGVNDELDSESVSGKRIVSKGITNEDTESLAPKIIGIRNVSTRADNQPSIRNDASTFGTWTDDISASRRKEADPDESGDNIDQLMPKWAPTPKLQQESVEIIFAHSTTAGSPMVSNHSAALDRQKRRSSSSKQSSTKSDEPHSAHDENGNAKLEPKPANTAYLYIQMQICRGTLKDWLIANNRPEDRDRSDMLDWFDQLICAMQYVHDLGLVHRDLKPSNIFFSATGLLKIGDFGLATTTLPSALPSELQADQSMADGDKNHFLSTSGLTLSPTRGTTDRVGTQLYMSPEQEAGRKCTSKADIYALGLIFIELLVPFKTLMERVHVIQDARRNVLSTDFEKECPQETELIRRLLSRDPEKRPTCLEIRQSDLFKPCLAIRPLLNRNDHYQPGRTVSRDSGRHSSVSASTP